jgi:imidazolonepropionase-like amidohydrolase
MRRLLFALLLIASTVRAGTVVIHDVTLIDGTGRPARAHVDVVINGATIEKVVDAKTAVHPRNARVIDGMGRYVIPGLVDMHAHLLLSAWNEKGELEPRYDRASVLQMLDAFLKFGVTTVRDPGAPTADAILWRRMVAERKVAGPRIFTAGRILNRSSFTPEPFVEVRSAEAVREEIGWQAKAGVDFIKVYSSMTPELVQVAIDEAHRLGLPVIGHLERTTWTEAAKMGIDGVEHPVSWSADYLPPQDRAAYPNSMYGRVYWIEHIDQDAIDELIRELVAHRVVVDPTLMAIHTKFWGDDERYTKSADLQFVPPHLLKGWPAGRFTKDWTPEQYAAAQKAWPKLLALTKKMYDGGVEMVVGTDTAGPWIVPGASVHDEMQLLADAGIPPPAIIRMATFNAARALRREKEFGSIQAGRRADLVVLTKNPLQSIANTRSIALVMQGGKIVGSNR